MDCGANSIHKKYPAGAPGWEIMDIPPSLSLPLVLSLSLSLSLSFSLFLSPLPPSDVFVSKIKLFFWLHPRSRRPLSSHHNTPLHPHNRDCPWYLRNLANFLRMNRICHSRNRRRRRSGQSSQLNTNTHTVCFINSYNVRGKNSKKKTQERSDQSHNREMMLSCSRYPPT